MPAYPYLVSATLGAADEATDWLDLGPTNEAAIIVTGTFDAELTPQVKQLGEADSAARALEAAWTEAQAKRFELPGRWLLRMACTAYTSGSASVIITRNADNLNRAAQTYQ